MQKCFLSQLCVSYAWSGLCLWILPLGPESELSRCRKFGFKPWPHGPQAECGVAPEHGWLGRAPAQQPKAPLWLIFPPPQLNWYGNLIDISNHLNVEFEILFLFYIFCESYTTYTHFRDVKACVYTKNVHMSFHGSTVFNGPPMETGQMCLPSKKLGII